MSLKAIGHYPGHISMVNTPNVDYPGVRAKWFWSVAQYNRFFTEEPGKDPKMYIVTGASAVPYFFGLFVGVLCHYTKQLSEEEAKDMFEASREVEFKMGEIRAKRRAEREEAAKVEQAAREEQARLALVGKKYEDRTKHMKSLAPNDAERKVIESELNAGDPEVLYATKVEAFKTGYLKGYKLGTGGDR